MKTSSVLRPFKYTLSRGRVKSSALSKKAAGSLKDESPAARSSIEESGLKAASDDCCFDPDTTFFCRSTTEVLCFFFEGPLSDDVSNSFSGAVDVPPVTFPAAFLFCAAALFFAISSFKSLRDSAWSGMLISALDIDVAAKRRPTSVKGENKRKLY